MTETEEGLRKPVIRPLKLNDNYYASIRAWSSNPAASSITACQTCNMDIYGCSSSFFWYLISCKTVTFKVFSFGEHQEEVLKVHEIGLNTPNKNILDVIRLYFVSHHFVSFVCRSVETMFAVWSWWFYVYQQEHDNFLKIPKFSKKKKHFHWFFKN